MRKLYITILFLFCFGKTFGQVAFQCLYSIPTINTIFGDNYQIIRSPDDIGYYNLCAIGTPQDSGIMLMKIHDDGSVLWAKTYQHITANFTTNTFDLLVLSDSTLMINGYDDGKTLSLKLDFSGNLIAARYFPWAGSTIYKEREVNGFLYGVGRFSSGGINGGFFCKRDLTGNVIWSKMMSAGTSKRIVLTSLTPTSDNGFLLAGWRQIYSTTLPASLVLIKTDSTGTILWQKQLNFGGNSMNVYQIEELPDNGFLFSMTGGTLATSEFMKIDSSGNVLWNYYYQLGISNPIRFSDFTMLGNNGFITCGMLSNVYPRVVVALKIDTLGNPIMAKEFETDTVSVFSNYFDEHGIATFGYKSNFYNFGLFALKTDSLFHSACEDTSITLTPISYTVTDSATSMVVIQLFAYTNDVTTDIEVNNFNISKSDYCPPVYLSVNETTTSQITWGPVPTLDDVEFRIANNEKAELRVYDISGRMVADQSFASEHFTFKRNKLKSGIYFFELIRGDEITKGKLLFE